MATGTSKIQNGTAIMVCTCVQEYQDSRYGRGRRVHNGCAGGYRCTGCGVEKSNK